ncbi:MAG: SocA family protein [Chloroflexi bacterium]|nr:SocA family protein [Chloroflexota bacterium]
MRIYYDNGIQREEKWNQDHPGEVFIANVPPNLSLFAPSELRVLATVKEKFHDFSAKKISEYSHGEMGYQEIDTARLIPYSYATQLNIEL